MVAEGRGLRPPFYGRPGRHARIDVAVAALALDPNPQNAFGAILSR